MTDTAILSGGPDTAVSTISGNALSYYAPFVGVNFKTTAEQTEANAQIKMRGASTLKNFTVNVFSNARTTSTSHTTRINGSPGNTSLSVGAGVTGVVRDATHSDSLADADAYCYRTLMGASAEAYGAKSVTAELDMTGQAFNQIGLFGTGTTSTASSTTFQLPAGGLNSNTTEATQQAVAMESATLSNMFEFVASNTRTATTYKSRVNTADGNQTFVVGASGTGYFEDATHSDSLVAADLFDISRVTGTGTNTLTYKSLGFKYLGSAANRTPLYGSGAAGVAGTNSATRFFVVGGFVSQSATEAQAQTGMPVAGTLSKFTFKVTVNTSGSANTGTIRINGADGNQTFSITANTAGVYQDATHTDSVVASDLVGSSFGASASAASVSINNISVLFAAGSGGTTTPQSCLAASSPLAALQNSAGAIRLASSSPLALLSRATAAIRQASSSPVAALTRSAGAIRRASSSPVASSVEQKVALANLPASSSPLASLSRQAGKILRAASSVALRLAMAITSAHQATTAPVATRVAAVTVIRRASSSPLASLATLKATIATLLAASSPLASLVRSVGAIRRATTTPTTRLTAATTKPLRATSSPVASLATPVVKLVSVLASTSPIARLVRSAGKLTIGLTSPVASRSAAVTRGAALTTSPVARLTRGAAKPIVRTTAPVASLASLRGAVLAAVTTPTVRLVKGTVRFAGTVTAPLASIAANLVPGNVILQAITAPVASLVTHLLRNLRRRLALIMRRPPI